MSIDQLKPFLDWLHLHPHWAGFFVFLISFGESIAVFGLLVPGSVVMTAIGALIGAKILPMYPMMMWAIAGAVIGDLLSFWLGGHFHQNVRNIWPFTRYPQVLTKGEAFFERHGGKSVFLGRFVGPIRPVIPLIAGMLNMKPLRFFIADIPAAIGWAPAYMLPGILLGELSLKLQPELASRFLLAVFALLIMLWLIYWLLKKLVLLVIGSINYLLTRTWRYFSPKQRWMAFMQVPGDQQNAQQFKIFVFFLGLIALFCLLTYSVIHHGIFTELNLPVFHFMRSVQTPLADNVMNGITFLGVGEINLVMVIVVALYLIAKRRFWTLFHWASLAPLSYAAVHWIKNWVKSPRPNSLLSTHYGWSFPSGHTTTIMVALGFLAVLVAQKPSLFTKRLCYSVVMLLVTAVAVSRLYLGFHWFSDVIGGILSGLIIVVGVTFSYRRREAVPLQTVSLCVVALCSWLLAWSIYTLHYFNHTPKTGTPYLSTQVLDEKIWWTQSGYESPLYRTNRFGKPVQLINIQWAGNLEDIQRALLRQGWQTPAKPDLALIVTSFANKEKSYLNPVLFTKYYRDRKPVLVMVKTVDNQRHIIILRLWNSHTVLHKSGYSIWVGTVSYYRPWQSAFLKHGFGGDCAHISAIDEFKKDLGPFRWKEVVYRSRAHPNGGENADWTGYALLVRPGV